MKRALFVLLSAAVAATALSQSGDFVPGQIVVRFKPNTQIAQLVLNAKTGAKVVRSVEGLDIVALQLPTALGVNQAIKTYASQKIVKYAEPNAVYYADFTPNDSLFAQQYAHKRIQTELAWDITQGLNTVKIAVIDTGCDINHPDLMGKVLPGHDFANNDDTVEDNQGHGTHVSGDAAASTNNSMGVAGPGFNCMVLPVKASEFGGFTEDAIINSIKWAADQGAHVINMSFGGWFPSQAIEDACNYAWAKGSVLVAAAGNDPVTDKHYPAAYPVCIAVAASDQFDRQSDFTTYGDWVDVASPGVAILSTTVGGGYEAWDGTSMASPVCAGVVGLIWSVAPSFTNTQIRALLEDNTDFVGNWVAHGRINAYKAVLAAPIYVTEPIPSTAIAVAQGTYLSGDLATLPTVDDYLYRVATVFQRGVGYAATVNVTFDGEPLSDEVKGMTLNINAKGGSVSTGMIYLWDRTKSRYVWMKSFPMGVNSTSITTSIELPKPLSKWVDANGVCKVSLRAVVPQRLGQSFVFSIDRAELTRKILVQ
ncbi:MAG: peptidase S8 [Armatimonadetes bacterium]|nr:peptidase S8 [Armatimonadota bacterium]